jgi:2'-5' RNA ligase
MRLFVALEVPEPVRREVRRRVAGLRERLPRARWVNPDVLHLTLLFLGEVAPERLAALAEGLRRAFAPFPELPLRLAGGGTFPVGRPARVAWIGVTAPPELAPLQAAAAQAARQAIGAPPADERSYHPHVTLARCPSPWPRGAAEKFVAAFPGEIGPPFVAARGVLVESRLSPRGPSYRDLADLPLGAATVPEAAAAAVVGGSMPAPPGSAAVGAAAPAGGSTPAPPGSAPASSAPVASSPSATGDAGDGS